jgi:hypothetical protein
MNVGVALMFAGSIGIGLTPLTLGAQAPSELEALTVAVDSLPFLIEQVWRPVEGRATVRLARYLPSRAEPDGNQAQVHPNPWFSSQLEKPFVLGPCGGPNLWACDRGDATMKVALALVSSQTDEEVVIDVEMSREVGGPPGGRGGFGVGVRVWLASRDGEWVYSRHEVVWIT